MLDLSGDMNGELEVELSSQILIGELSNSLSIGVSRRLFDALHQSFSELNHKLASRVEINIASDCHDSDRPFENRETSRPSPSTPAQALGHSDPCEDLHDTLKLSEGQNDGTIEKCCLCLTPASEEELVTTPCCQRSIGSICFEERLEETGKCCLCQAYQPESHPSYLATPWEDTTGYKHHFTTVSAPPTKLQASLPPKETTPHSKEGDDHHVTKSHRLKLIDPDVIYHLKEVRKGDLLDLVHSALIEPLRQTVCKGFFHQAGSVNGKFDVLICLKCSQEPDLMQGMKDWPRAFESFVLTTQLQSFKVTVDHIQIGTMKISQSFDKSTTIRTLVEDNTSVLKSLTSPADIRGICWNKKIIGLNPIESTSITITFRTAQQANEAIEQGILWHHQRRLCRRQGAHPRITQCGHCQAYGHRYKDCCSTPRCCICAGDHLSTACAHDPAVDKACLKCVLCSGRHEATSENCMSRKIERERLQLENRFYTTGATKAEQGGAASAA